MITLSKGHLPKAFTLLCHFSLRCDIASSFQDGSQFTIGIRRVGRDVGPTAVRGEEPGGLVVRANHVPLAGAGTVNRGLGLADPVVISRCRDVADGELKSSGARSVRR